MRFFFLQNIAQIRLLDNLKCFQELSTSINRDSRSKFSWLLALNISQVFDKLYNTDLKSNEDNKVLFKNLIWSNGFNLDCLFYKRKRARKDPINSLVLKIIDFALEEVEQHDEPIFIGSSRTSVFTGAKELDIKTILCFLQHRRIYYHYTGSTKFAVTQK